MKNPFFGFRKRFQKSNPDSPTSPENPASRSEGPIPENLIPASQGLIPENFIPASQGPIPENLIPASQGLIPENFIPASQGPIPENLIPASQGLIPENLIPASQGLVYFISGHVDISLSEFVEHYSSPIEKALNAAPIDMEALREAARACDASESSQGARERFFNAVPRLEPDIPSKCRFVIGNAAGTDRYAQQYLRARGFPMERVTVYYVGMAPPFIKARLLEPPDDGLLSGGFSSFSEKDAAMTSASDIDIAWVRTQEEQKILFGDKYRYRVSNTERNLLRRKALEMDRGKKTENEKSENQWPVGS